MLAKFAGVEHNDSDGNKECGVNEYEGHGFSKGSLTVFSLFGINELKESVASVCFVDCALSIFEHVEVEGLDDDVEDEELDNDVEVEECDIENALLSILP